jgi:hypothetical protein
MRHLRAEKSTEIMVGLDAGEVIVVVREQETTFGTSVFMMSCWQIAPNTQEGDICFIGFKLFTGV